MDNCKLMLEGLRQLTEEKDPALERESLARMRARKTITECDIEILLADARRDPIAWRAAHLLAVGRRSTPRLREFLQASIRGYEQAPKPRRGKDSTLDESRDMAIVMTMIAMLEEGYQLSENEVSSRGVSACAMIAEAVGLSPKRVHEIWRARDRLPWN
nr:hypothetical protein [uncultured Halomonas sp.]